jgi:protein SCO1/2
MNTLNKPCARRAAILAALLALAGCGAGSQPVGEPPLAGASIGGDFTLTASDGRRVNWQDFAGRYRVVYFGYAFCPDICPTDMQRVAQGLKVLKADDPAKAAKVQPIFITIDPERDTREVVGEFAAAFSPDIIGLTGTPDEIAAAAKAFKVFYARGEEIDGGGYLVDHSNIVYLFGPGGEPIATLPVDQGADAVAAELDRWVS